MPEYLQSRNDPRQWTNEGKLALSELVFLFRMFGIVIVVYAIAWPARQILALKR